MTSYLVCGYNEDLNIDYFPEFPLKVVTDNGAIESVIEGNEYDHYTVYRIEPNGDLTEIILYE